MSIKQEGGKKQCKKLKSALCFLSATFQFTTINFKQLYLLDFLLKLGKTNLARNLRKSDFTWIKLTAIWSYRLGDIGQKMQHVQARRDSAASEKKAPIDL